MPYVPPWLDVSPRDFLAAAQGGARIGAELAGQASERGIASARNATALQEAQMRENTAMSGQQAEAALAQARLEQAAKQQQAEQVLKQWEIQQQIKRQQDTLAATNQRAGSELDFRKQALEAENQRAAAALAERQKYGDSMLDIRREANRIAQERAEKPANNPANFTTVSEHTKEVPDTKKYTVSVPGVHNWFSANTPPRTFDTTNVLDLPAIGSGATIATNTIPGTGTPARTISRRIPIGQDPYALSVPAAPPSPFEGKKVRDKVTGQTGIISNGQFVPDTEDQNLDGDAASM